MFSCNDDRAGLHCYGCKLRASSLNPEACEFRKSDVVLAEGWGRRVDCQVTGRMVEYLRIVRIAIGQR